MLLSFGAPTLVLNGVPIRVVSIIRHGSVGRLFRVECTRVVATRVGRRYAVNGTKDVNGLSDEGEGTLRVPNSERYLRRALSTVRSAGVENN